MKTKSLRTRLVIFFVIVTLIPLAVVGITIKNISEDILTQRIEENASVVLSNLEDTITNYIDNNALIIRFLSSTDQLRSMDFDTQIELLSRFIWESNEFETFYIIDTADNSIESYPYGRVSEDLDSDLDSNDLSWYQGAINNGGLYIDKEDRLDDTGTPHITLSVPIRDNTGSIIGVLAADISIHNLRSLVNNIEIGETGFSFITNKDGYPLVHQNNLLVQNRENFSHYYFVQDAILGETGFSSFYDEEFNETFFVAYQPIEDLEWGIFIQQSEQEAFAQAYEMSNRIYLLVGGAFLLAALAGIIISGKIVNPIKELVSSFNVISKGDLTTELKIKDKTEIGLLGQEFNKMMENLRNLITSVKSASSKLLSSADDLAASSEETNVASQEVANAIQEIASGATEQVKKVSDISNITDKVNESNQIVTENSQKTTDYSKELSQNAENSKKEIESAVSKIEGISGIVGETAENIKSLDTKVGEIGSITNIIGEIVDQTNLLALNASIEAARAGEAGRGFAVVADEIRSLAEESGKAAKQIIDIIEDIQEGSKKAVKSMNNSTEEVKEGTKMISSLNNTLNNIIQKIHEVSVMAEEISGEAKTQYEDMQSLKESVTSISAVAEEAAASTEEASASTEEQTSTIENVTASANDLAQMADDLKKQIERFTV